MGPRCFRRRRMAGCRRNARARGPRRGPKSPRPGPKVKEPRFRPPAARRGGGRSAARRGSGRLAALPRTGSGLLPPVRRQRSARRTRKTRTAPRGGGPDRRFQGKRNDGAHRAHRFQPLADFGVRPAALACGHRSALVEDLDADRAALGQRCLGAIRLGARCQAIKTGESSFQEIALMLEFLEVRFNLIGVQPAQAFLRPQPAQALLGR